MASTVANLSSVLKDAWTSAVMKKQFYDENPLLDWFQGTSPTMIGAQAQVPIHKRRSGPSTSTNAAGGVLNPAGNQVVDQALYTIPYLWRQINLEVAAINQTGGNAQSIVNAKDFEIEGAVNDISRDASRMLANNGDGLIAQCTTGGASTTVNLLPAASGGLGFDAIVRDWLRVDMVVDIGTTADTDVLATGAVISAVAESATAPTITTATSVTTTSSHYVSVANPNSASAANPEINGLRNMISTATLGGVNPASAGNEYWQPGAAALDTTTTSFSLDLLLNINRTVFQKSGNAKTSTILMSAKQMTNFYSLLQNQVRFTGERDIGAGGIGNMDGLKWNGMGINVWPDIADKELYAINRDDFERITGNIKAPTWTSEIEGGGQGLRWAQGTTSFVEGIVFPIQVGMNRRNRSGAATNLVA